MHQLIIYGPPGVGKGTQAELIAAKLNLEHISTGAILRKAAEDGTELGIQAKEIMDRGNLVTDDIMNGIVKESLKKINKNGFILDGYPRTLVQAMALSEIFNELGFKDIKVINLIADENEIITRLLKRGRSDDNRETIANRFKVYLESTSPVKEYFSKQNIIMDINGVGDIEDINKVILESIK
ncbi:MAG: adenylate kinase [Bacteroidetes bacterium]|nr:adenylate kinase [Bacteroidota bacterium]